MYYKIKDNIMFKKVLDPNNLIKSKSNLMYLNTLLLNLNCKMLPFKAYYKLLILHLLNGS